MTIARTIFDLVGGEAKLEKIVDDFARRLKANPELGPLYPDDMSRLKTVYKNYAMELFGGPEKFSQQQSPRGLAEAHEDIAITPHRADEMIKCAVETMEHFHIPKGVQQKAREKLEAQVRGMVNA